MSETVNQGQTATAAEPAEGSRTFTQDEMNAIIADRLGRERAKYADYEALKDKAAKYDAAEEASKTELEKAQEKARTLQAKIDSMVKADRVRQIREKVAASKGIPVTLLSKETEEECIEQADAILNFAKPGGYPKVKDGGEPQKPTGKQSTSEQFAEWMEKMNQ